MSLLGSRAVSALQYSSLTPISLLTDLTELLQTGIVTWVSPELSSTWMSMTFYLDEYDLAEGSALISCFLSLS